jgi:hypothetical protein
MSCSLRAGARRSGSVGRLNNGAQAQLRRARVDSFLADERNGPHPLPMTIPVPGGPSNLGTPGEKQHAGRVQLAPIYARTWHSDVPIMSLWHQWHCARVSRMSGTRSKAVGCRVGICETVSVPGDLGDETETVS